MDVESKCVCPTTLTHGAECLEGVVLVFGHRGARVEAGCIVSG